MKFIPAAFLLLFAACTEVPEDPPPPTHICTTGPTGLVQCDEIP
ncbi:MAG: hypothetical protein ACK4GW_02070 [Pseudorhodobacter sp.]